MASTHTELVYHFIWSTKHRQPLILPEIESSIWKILAGTAKRNGMQVIKAGGVENHVHVLLRIPKTLSVSHAVQRLKGGTSKFINDEQLIGVGTGTGGDRSFAWQDGYAAFTVSASNIPAVVDYIAHQREHHRTKTFEEEFVAFLDRHEISYDSRYLWD